MTDNNNENKYERGLMWKMYLAFARLVDAFIYFCYDMLQVTKLMWWLHLCFRIDNEIILL